MLSNVADCNFEFFFDASLLLFSDAVISKTEWNRNPTDLVKLHNVFQII